MIAKRVRMSVSGPIASCAGILMIPLVPPASHAILGWRESSGSDTREVTRPSQFRENEMNEAIRPARNAELGASNEEFQNLHEFVRKARANLNQNAWDYIVGAAET
jgi:hypothetical protein